MIYFDIMQHHRQTMQPARPRAQRIVHEKAHPVVPDIARSRLAGCIHRPLVQQIPPISDLA